MVCVQGAYGILVNPSSGGSRPLGGFYTNLFLSGSTVTVTAPSWKVWLPFHDVYNM